MPLNIDWNRIALRLLGRQFEDPETQKTLRNFDETADRAAKLQERIRLRKDRETRLARANEEARRRTKKSGEGE